MIGEELDRLTILEEDELSSMFLQEVFELLVKGCLLFLQCH
jgi:hypothetical protein